MEKITDEELKSMLTKTEENPDEIRNEETGEVQWVKATKEEVAEAFDEVSLQNSLEQNIDFNTIPEVVENSYEEKPLDPVLEKRHELTIGLTPEDIQAFFDYVAGKADKPLFVDKFMADTEGRLKEMATIMMMAELSSIPTKTALVRQMTERLFAPENLYDMDSKTLTSAITNMNKDIMNILDVSLRTVQTTSQFGSLNNEYRRLLDSMMMLPAEKLKLVQDTILEDEKKLDEK